MSSGIRWMLKYKECIGEWASRSPSVRQSVETTHFGVRQCVCVLYGMNKFALLTTLTFITLSGIWLMPPIHQSQAYHQFANHTEHLGIANFWNVISNLAFLLVAAVAWPHLRSPLLCERWKRNCFRALLVGIALTTFGSAYYHLRPCDASLVWDRLPMTIVFMSVLSFTMGDRIDSRLSERLLWPLLAIGGLSVIWWRFSGDLRLYVAVQFYPLIAVPVMLCMRGPKATTGLAAQWGMIAFYGAAKAAEMLDGRFLGVPGGAHAWKHVFSAAGLLIYTQAIPRSGSKKA